MTLTYHQNNIHLIFNAELTKAIDYMVLCLRSPQSKHPTPPQPQQPLDQSTTTTTTNTNDLTMSDLENNNNNDQIPSTSTLFPDVVPTTTRPDSLPSDVFQATLIASKTPISSSIVPGQLENKQ
ncbi:hypothetical protein PPL_09387 [Heterostelium album PN500]|uniref:Uncharacterized protein n=1 Tax=Heterostelium pallidum (strain ATCC 26659 / Pp 5 / PN500) TaxID=670386 RepID=D3BLF3_HETP5|nr:hypothetical protein PPL_09387 [Heterostelium album PN500]EFA77887.1 hypothetical protein PPL_09387 [Heterostelium album PN500]|eukprot:XP_020430015.1 hypothetical protein PPL_09387 [Heterostelium album PN500]